MARAVFRRSPAFTSRTRWKSNSTSASVITATGMTAAMTRNTSRDRMVGGVAS